MYKQQLKQKQSQQLLLTPQLQQAIQLVAMNNIELATEIQQQLMSNPFLEVHELEDELALDSNVGEDADELNEEYQSINEELDYDADWKDVYADANHSSHDGMDDVHTIIEKTHSANSSLKHHIMWQVNMSNLTEIDKFIADVVTDYIDGRGYLTESISSLLLHFDPALELEYADINSVVHFIQQSEPLGCASSCLEECLLVQWNKTFVDDVQTEHGRVLLKKHLPLLHKQDYIGIRRALKIKPDALAALVDKIKTLDPFPGQKYNNDAAEYITPDVYVKKIRGEWRISINNELIPKVAINTDYIDLIDSTNNADDKSYMKENMRAATWFLSSIENRNKSIIKVANYIIEHQEKFFKYGAQALSPLQMKSVAEALDINISTVSRVANSKYMHTPLGILPFKYFFSSQLSNDMGGSHSSTSVQEMIKELIENESPHKPISDQYIETQLTEQGINIARRTVAKYREALGIPSTRLRKRVAL